MSIFSIIAIVAIIVCAAVIAYCLWRAIRLMNRENE